MAKHIEIVEDLLPLLGKKEDILDGVTGFVEHYDYSKANSSYEARVQAITKVASICYQSPKSLGSVSLFDRLQAESAGLPSSSYEFVPVLISLETLEDSSVFKGRSFNHFCKYGELINNEYYLGNLRGLIEDVGADASLDYLNTSDEEIKIIRDNFKVFLFNVDLPTRAQMVRHRVSWQELSRRYVAGKKKAFEFYVSKKIKHVYVSSDLGQDEWGQDIDVDTEDVIDLCVKLYNKSIASGVKPEEARRILPQAMMTQIWGAFQPKQLEGFFKLRLHKTAQREIQQTAKAMHELIP